MFSIFFSCLVCQEIYLYFQDIFSNSFSTFFNICIYFIFYFQMRMFNTLNLSVQ